MKPDLLFFYSFISLLLSVVFVKLSILIANKYGIVDNPGARKVHSKVTPRMGGFGIFLSFHLVLLYFAYSVPAFRTKLTVLILGGLLVFLVGLLDDIYSLKPSYKLLIEVLAALLLIFGDIRITMYIKSYPVTAIITILWVVGITNSFNLLDNMDGLSSGLASLSSFFLFCIALRSGNTNLAILFLSFSFVLLGFLRFNYSPAQTFMGDCGSLYIGFMLSSFAIMGNYVSNSRLQHFPLLIPLFIFAIPIYDTLSVIIIRIKNKKPIFLGDKNHFSHRLESLGFKKSSSVLFIIFMAAQIDLSVILIPGINREQALIILFQTIISFFLITLLMFTGKTKITEAENGNKDH